MIEVDQLVKSFGKVQALKGASFTAKDGEITTLLGANGSGKTTTLRSLVGLVRPDSGMTRVNGINVLDNPEESRRAMGWFPDTFGLYPRLTVREHMRYFARLHGVKGAPLDQAIDEVVGVLNIADIIDRRTEGFSTGQSMKVALARAMIHRPQNLVLDEPTRGLDVMSIRHLRDTLRRLRDEGRCILMTSHVMAEVSELSDRVVFIADGKVVAEGKPQEIITKTGVTNLEEAFVALAA